MLETCAGCGNPIRRPYRPVWTWEHEAEGSIVAGVLSLVARRAHVPWHRHCLKAAS